MTKHLFQSCLLVLNRFLPLKEYILNICGFLPVAVISCHTSKATMSYAVILHQCKITLFYSGGLLQV